MKRYVAAVVVGLALCSCSDQAELEYRDQVIADLRQEVEAGKAATQAEVQAVERRTAQQIRSLQEEVNQYRMEERQRVRALGARATPPIVPLVTAPPAVPSPRPAVAQAQATRTCHGCSGFGRTTCQTCSGGKFGPSVKTSTPCKACGGAGKVAELYVKYDIRGGTGQKRQTIKDTYDKNCGTCGGSGQNHKEDRTYCTTCNGSGVAACTLCSGKGRL